MTHQLTFASLYNYPTDAILLPVALRHGERIARADAYLDTGSTFCVFKRELGEALDLERDKRTRRSANPFATSFFKIQAKQGGVLWFENTKRARRVQFCVDRNYRVPVR